MKKPAFIKFLADKSFRWKIMVCVISALVLMCISLFILLKTDLRAMNVIEDAYVSNAELNSYLEVIRETEQSMEDYVQYRTFEGIDNYYTHRAKIIEYCSLLHQNPSTDVIEQKSFVVYQLSYTYENFSNQVIVARRSNNDSQLEEYYPKTRECYRFLVGQVSELNNLLLQRNARSYTDNRHSISIVHQRSIALFCFMLLLVTFLLYIIITSITKPLGDISAVALRVAERDFDVPLFERDTHDEIGNICRAFDRMIISIREYIETIWKKARTENELREKEIEMRALYSDAQLRALQSQINPHFLFNTLNTGVQLAMMEGADKTSYFIEQVASFFRYNIQQQKQVATIDEELGLVDNFVYIMKVRFGKRLEFIKDVPECEFTEMVPTMTLQPLVENCIKHGLKNTMGRVELKVTRLDECVEIRISDNGAGFDEEIRQKILVPIHTDEIMLSEDKNITEVNKTKEDKKLSDGEMHNGIGIINVLLRLKLYFHRDDVFDIPRSEPGQGATFVIRVPKNV